MNRIGFSLVEILIVVIILGILAAIVVPQFTEASGDAKLSSLATDLQTVRRQLQLYRLHHDGQYPSKDGIVTQLTTKTDVNGDAGGDLGPYLTTFPTNPFTGTADVKEGTRGDDKSAWHYDEDTGEFAPDDAAHSGM